MLLPVQYKKHLALFAELQKADVGKCWAPFVDCPNSPINAHSVQNRRTLELIQEAGKVTQIGGKLTQDGQNTVFRKVGRNKASTFRGLCAEHDREIFKLIDTNPLDSTNSHMCDLLVWRAITSEMAAKLNMAVYFQTKYKQLIENEEIAENEPHPFGYEAVQWMAVLFDFFCIGIDTGLLA